MRADPGCGPLGLIFMSLMLAVWFSVGIAIPSSAQETEPSDSATLTDPDLKNPIPRESSSGAGGRQAHITYKTPYEFHLTTATVALGVLMAGLICVLSLRGVVHTEVLRTFLLVMIIFSALFLIVAGYSEKQTAPVFGLLGTILGYMFGRAVGPEQSTTPPPSQKDPPTTNGD